MTKKLLILMLGLLLAAGAAFAQGGRTVTGTITLAEDGSPAIGASVVVKGTTLGAVTGFDGKFTLSGVPASATTLVISSIGFVTVEVPIQNVVNVAIEADTEALDELIVVAYGTQSLKSSTGSVSLIDDEKISQRVGTSATGALEGAAPGIQVNNTYGEPGSSPSIRIRGFGSINIFQAPF